MNAPATDGAKTIENSGKDNPKKLRHVHIGLFFDGTSNNMVQQLMYNGSLNISFFGLGEKQVSADLKKKLKDFQYLKIALINDSVIISEKHLELFNSIDEEIDALKEKISEAENASEKLDEGKKQIYDLMAELHAKNLVYINLRQLYGHSPSALLMKEIEIQKKDLARTEEKLDKVSASLEVSDKNLMDYSDENGFSNISVLYSLFNKQLLELQEETPAKAIKFYIEGSGATNMACLKNADIEGLGFGLGDTGVTALVSKGIKLVSNYIDSLEPEIDEGTKVHLYVFGFSRGATCARLFTHIATRRRDNSEVLQIREREFLDFIPDLMDESGRVKFLEETKLNWHNISVDILGIYDTVASIGFLRQKDGWHDPLYGAFSHIQNYYENWHYKNVTQYGLYLSANRDKLKNVIHIGALDEFRENFAFTNIGATIADNAVEILIPGCHSDVGGGYMDGIEQEISLPFFTTKKGKQVNTSILLHRYDKEPVGVYFTAPGTKIGMNQLQSAPIRAKSLEYVGWIANWDDEKNKNKKDRTTISMAEHLPHLTKYIGLERWGFVNKIYFKRRVKRGWSDVALKMMIEMVNISLKGNSLKNDLFQFPSIYDYNYTITDHTAKKIASSIISKCSDLKSGNRYLMIPGGNVSSELYKHLRLYYIHFTSSISLAHGVNPLRNWEWNSPFEGSGANFGNKPNFDLKGNLCRITYNGDKDKSLAGNNPDKGYETHVNYMYNLEFSKILTIDG